VPRKHLFKKKLIFALAPEQCYIALFEGKTKLKKIKNKKKRCQGRL
jgi:hypothetical protein